MSGRSFLAGKPPQKIHGVGPGASTKTRCRRHEAAVVLCSEDEAQISCAHCKRMRNLEPKGTPIPPRAERLAIGPLRDAQRLAKAKAPERKIDRLQTAEGEPLPGQPTLSLTVELVLRGDTPARYYRGWWFPLDVAPAAAGEARTVRLVLSQRLAEQVGWIRGQIEARGGLRPRRTA